MSENSMWMIKALVVLFVLLLLGLLYSNLPVKATYYTITDSRIANSVKIVFLSDLHSEGVTDGNQDLIRKVTEQKPDMIALVGDMIDDSSTEADMRSLVGSVATLARVAPVYYSMGNDEFAYIRRNGRSVLDALAAAGASILDETFLDVNLNGSQFRIGGLYALAFRLEGKTPDSEWLRTSRFLGEFEQTESPKILLCHRPDSFIYNHASRNWDIDYLLSGHAHGGLFRLPLLGGLYAAGQGFFPKYDYGRHRLDNMTMFISSGLTGYKRLPRIWNRREIVVLELGNGK